MFVRVPNEPEHFYDPERCGVCLAHLDVDPPKEQAA
jgi:hypothetical protein